MTPAGRPDASGSRPGAPEHLWRVRLPIAVATAALVAGSATLASAQDPSEPAGQLTDPYATGEQAANQQSLDTDWTPNAKETDLFQQVAGSAWDERRNDPATAFVPGDPRTGVILGSATSFEDNLYTVAFSEQQGVGGIAGGATCEDPEPYSESGCVPVLYQYRTFEPARGLEWRKLELPGADEPGYVGEVAWIGRTGRALAVGGTGTYPRREPAYGKDIDGNDCPTPGPPGQDREPYGARCDQAGMARAWLYDPERFSENGGWCELGPGAPCGAIPEGPRGQQMRGLSALDFDRAQGRELGFAGALGQIWTWKEGRFTGGMVDSTSPECMRVPPNEEGFGGACPGGANSGDAALWLAKLFRFRVREIRFVPGQKDPVAMAVTSGCCTETALTDYPALLVYGGTVGQARQWSLFHLSDEREDGTPTQGSPTCGSGAPFIGLTGPRGAQCALGFAPNTQPQRPDSLYSITVSKNSGQGVYRVSAVASPGGPERPGEPPSTVTARYCRWSGGRSHVDTPGSGGYLTDLEDPLRVNLSTARLVAGDGDVAAVSLNTNRPPAPYLEGSQELSFSPSAPSATDTNGFVPPGGCSSGEGRAVGNNPPDPDSVPDWVVGELRSTDREDLGARGLLLANPQRPSLLPKTIKPNPATSEVADGSYRPTDPDKLQAYASSQYFLLPSYGLGAIDIIGASSSGWAVGDHGAILRLDEKVAKTSVPEPEPPRLGGRRPAELPDAAPYEEAHRAEASGAGPVPGLGAQPLERLAEPRLVPAGSPDPEGPSERGGSGTILGQSVNEIAVSRDGSEGWAVGPFIDRVRGEFSLYRFDGSSWTLCDPFGIAGQRPPDPACEELAEIAEFTDANGNLLATRLRAIARVPLENDSDPTNDDEFEAVAVGSGYIPAGAEEDFAGKVEVPVVLRYREGRWRLEDAQARAAITKTTAGASVTSPLEGLRDVAFTAPDDGWVLGKSGSSWLFHFDGERWIPCSAEWAKCFDGGPTRRLTFAFSADPGTGAGSGTLGGGSGLVAAGDRVYLSGIRNISTETRCPALVYHER